MEKGSQDAEICQRYRRRVDDLRQLISLEARLDSFKTEDPNSDSPRPKYPHSTKKLNPTTLAKAGFVRGSAQLTDHEDLTKRIGLDIVIEDDEDDTVFCPYCFKHLSEFEPDDQPFQEHKDHKSNCIFINQVASSRARTSQWMDPLNAKPAKTKQKITIADIQDMRNTVSKAHWEYIENYQKALLQEEACLSPQLWMLNNLKRRRNSARKDRLKEAIAKGPISKLATGQQAIGESPKIDPRSIPKSDLCEIQTLKLSEILRAVSVNLATSHNLPSSQMSQKMRAPLQGISANYTFSPVNAVLPNATKFNTAKLTGKENRNLTPMMSKSVPKMVSTPYNLHNQTVSMQSSDIPESTETVADNVYMSPRTPVIGKTKTMYVNLPGGRVLPLQMEVSKKNVQELKRLSRADFK